MGVPQSARRKSRCAWATATALVCAGFAPVTASAQAPDLLVPSQVLTAPESGGSTDGLYGAGAVAASADGQNVYALGVLEDAVVTFTRDPSTGTLTRTDLDVDTASGGTVSGMRFPRSVAVAPDGRHVYVTSGVDDTVTTFIRRLDTGALRWLERDVDPSSGGEAEGLDGASGVVVSPDGKTVYVASQRDSAVVTFKRNDGGRLIRLEEDRQGATADGVLSVSGVAVSPDGKSVYAAGTGSSAVATFKRSVNTGRLTWIGTASDPAVGGKDDGLEGAYDVEVSPDSATVYAASLSDASIVVFKRNPLNGRLVRIQRIERPPRGFGAGMLGLNDLSVSPDGRSVYATGGISDALVSFERDQSTGRLWWTEQDVDPVSGGSTPGLDGIEGAAVSPDGAYVYSAAKFADSVAVLARTPPPDGGISANPVLRMEGTALPEGDAGLTGYAFDLWLDRPSHDPVTVTLASADGSATADEDYRPITTSVTFEPGRVFKQVSVPVLGDDASEGDESFTLMVTDVAGAAAPDGERSATIQEDDAPPPPPGAPNVLLIVTDDQPPGMMEAMPRTLAAFAERGTEFTNAIVTQPVCCPSRASIFSGLYPHNHGIQENFGSGFDSERTWVRHLHDAGYYTGIVGKYLNGVSTARSPNFDYRKGWGADDPADARLASDGADEFLTRAEADDARPWALTVAAFSPHAPWNAEPTSPMTSPPPDVPPPSLTESTLADKTPFVRYFGARWNPFPREEARSGYLMELQAIDETIGSVFGALERMDEERDTLAVFLSDNGMLNGEHFLSYKQWPYREAVEVPFFVRWPGHVAEGEQNPSLVANIDIAPTIFEATGVEPGYAVDGRSIFSGPPRDWVLVESNASMTIRSWRAYVTPDRHYVEWDDGWVEDYDLLADPFQLEAGNVPDPMIGSLLDAASECAGAACP